MTRTACLISFRGRNSHTLAGGVKGTHVEDVDALHLSDQLETLETGGLDEVGRDGSGLGARRNQVILGLDLCKLGIGVSDNHSKRYFVSE